MTQSRMRNPFTRTTKPATPLPANIERELAKAVGNVRKLQVWDRITTPQFRTAALVAAGALAVASGITVGTIQYLRYRQTRQAITDEVEMITDLEQIATKELVTEFAGLTPP